VQQGATRPRADCERRQGDVADSSRIFGVPGGFGGRGGGAEGTTLYKPPGGQFLPVIHSVWGMWVVVIIGRAKDEGGCVVAGGRRCGCLLISPGGGERGPGLKKGVLPTIGRRCVSLWVWWVGSFPRTPNVQIGAGRAVLEKRADGQWGCGSKLGFFSYSRWIVM
jgi:hypothetical protein